MRLLTISLGVIAIVLGVALILTRPTSRNISLGMAMIVMGAVILSVPQ